MKCLPLLDFLFPPRCAVCSEVTPRGTVVCPHCLDALPLHRRAVVCAVCGKPFGSCVCRGEPFAFATCVSAFAYGDRVSGIIELLKRHPESPAAGQIASMMADALRCRLPCLPFDCVTEVPMPPEEIFARGHNHAKTLALLLSQALDVPYRETPLVRHARSPAQHTLSAGMRAQNAKSSYARAPDGRIAGRVLLIDDVTTTGATLDRCAELLLQCGAAKVCCLTGATTLLREHPHSQEDHYDLSGHRN